MKSERNGFKINFHGLFNKNYYTSKEKKFDLKFRDKIFISQLQKEDIS